MKGEWKDNEKKKRNRKMMKIKRGRKGWWKNKGNHKE
jgi:hypothetical protein